MCRALRVGVIVAGLLASGSAHADALSSWSGFYLGAYAGFGSGNSYWTDASNGQPTRHDIRGGLYGAQIGWQHQAGRFVAGLEGSWTGGNFAGEAECTNINTFANPCRTTINAFVLAVAKGGYLVTDHLLVSAHGGFAYARVSDDLFFDLSFVGTGEYGKANHPGWAVGVGIDYMIAPQWVVGIDYMIAPQWVVGIDYTHVFLKTARHYSQSTFSPGDILPKDLRADFDLLRLKIGYLFGPGR